MSKLYFIARDQFGDRINGAEEASSQDELALRLQARDLTVINILTEEESKEAEKENVNTRRTKRLHSGINSHDMVLFCRQLATLLGAGVTILKCLDILTRQLSSRTLYNITKNVMKDMEAGMSLHGAMAKYPQVFSDLWVNLVESGEASGSLAIVLTRLASYLERSEAFKKKIISALMYPMILVIAGFGALIFMTVKIIPSFTQLFEGFNVKLPALTQMLIFISKFIRTYYSVMLGALIAAVFLFRRYIRTKPGRRVWENFLFKLPVGGEFFQALAVERFSSNMSTLIESGVPILYSLEIAEHSVGNLMVADIIRKVKDDVRNGRPLSQELELSGFFEPMVVQMVAVGEEIGELPQMFKKINEFYQEYIETFLTRFTALFEPIMLVFMGAVIGLMVVGMFLPIFQLSQIGG